MASTTLCDTTFKVFPALIHKVYPVPDYSYAGVSSIRSISYSPIYDTSRTYNQFGSSSHDYSHYKARYALAQGKCCSFLLTYRNL